MWIVRESNSKTQGKTTVLFYLIQGEPGSEKLTEQQEERWDAIIITGVKNPVSNIPKSAVALAEHVNINIKKLQQDTDMGGNLEFYAYIDPDINTDFKKAIMDALKLIITDVEVTILEQLD